MKTKLIFLVTVAALGIAPFMLSQPSLAETYGDPQSDTNFKNQNERDSFTGSNNGSLNMFDLMHKANFNNRPMEEFSAEKRQNLNDSAAKFRDLQLQRMRRIQNTAQPDNNTVPAANIEITPAANQ